LTSALKLAAACGCIAWLSGCASDGQRMSPLSWPHKTSSQSPLHPVLPPAGSGRGGYYQGDGPGANPPPNLDQVPDAEFKVEPYAKFANRPYSVFGQTYTPILGEVPYSQQGVASWYGVKFHGQRTSSGEPYDMYKMTAAHPTLPIPSYARITSLETGKQVVVRINDRGPFHSSRLIDVSYTAALKLGLLGKGSHKVQVDRMLAPDPSRALTLRREAQAAAQSLPVATMAPDDISALMLQDRMTIENAAPAVNAVAAVPAAPASGFYLQIGSWGRAVNAESERARLQAAGVDAATLDVAQTGNVYRLYRGPYSTRAAAQDAIGDMPPSLGLKPFVIKR
jgi:rare lipoprotein A